MTDTKGDKCGIDPIQIGGWPRQICLWHDRMYTEDSWAEHNLTRKQVDDHFLAMLLEASKSGRFQILKRIGSYGMWGVARLLGGFFWEGK